MGKFAIKDLPLSVFRAAADELGLNFVDHSQKTYVVNVTTFQNIAGKVLLRFLSAETVSKIFMSSKPDDPKIRKFISASQLEKKYGGTAPNLTRFWPPTMPEYTDFNDFETVCNFALREKYNEFYMSHPGLTLMPESMR